MMLSTQNGGAETFFEKLALAFDEAGVPQCLIIEADERREALFANCKNLELHTVRYRGIHEPVGRLRAWAILKRYRPDLILTWMNRATKRAPRGLCPVLARYGGYYKIDRCRDCDRVIANTPDIRRYLLENGINAGQVVHVPNFAEIQGSDAVDVTTRGEVRRELGYDEADHVLLAIGRLHKVKAHDTLIRAMADVPEVKLMIAGDGPLKDELEALIDSLGLKNRVYLLGWREDTARLFAAADLCVFPSRFEPFGNVVVEAWAQRVPLIAADSTGPRWLIEDGVDGHLFPVDDVDALAEAIKKVAADAALQKQYIENDYAKFKEQFSVPVVVNQYLEVFRSVLKPE